MDKIFISTMPCGHLFISPIFFHKNYRSSSCGTDGVDAFRFSNGVFTPEQANDKTNVEPVHSYDAFHTRSDMSGVKGIIGMHRFNICLDCVLSLSCSGVKTP